LVSSEELPLWDNQALILECENRALYYTRIIKITEDTIFTQYPVNKDGVPMTQPLDKQVSVNFYNDHNEKYMFDSTLNYHNKKVSFSIPDVDSIRKVQKREYFRVPASLELCLDTGTGSKCSFITNDISGGGVSFFCMTSDIWNVNEIVAGGICLSDSPEKIQIPFSGRIAHIRPNNTGLGVAIEFSDIKETERRKIIQYCLKRQIELRNVLGEGQKVAQVR
jgi:c-di-GMP-binding flagellar brake protein YcgR